MENVVWHIKKKPGHLVNLGELVRPETYNLLCVGHNIFGHSEDTFGLDYLTNTAKVPCSYCVDGFGVTFLETE